MILKRDFSLTDNIKKRIIIFLCGIIIVCVCVFGKLIIRYERFVGYTIMYITSNSEFFFCDIEL